MSLEENLQTHWKEKYARQDEEQNSEADIPNFRVSFLGRRATNEKDGHNEDNSSRELDDFIASERSWNIVKKRNTSGKSLKDYANS